MTNPFDYVNSISTNKKHMMRDTENDVLAEKDYKPWVVNKALSYFVDTLLFANDMNMYHELDHRPQYEYLLNGIRRGKRWSKWAESKKSDDLEAVIRTYNCNPNVAQGYLEMLTEDQLKQIKVTRDTGGIPK